MRCPHCSTPLSRLTIGTLELDECPACLGMWFDRGELQRLLAAEAARALPQRYAPRAGNGPEVAAAAACPRCFGALRASEEAEVRACVSCRGAWYPAAVLGAILDGGAASDAAAAVQTEQAEEDTWAHEAAPTPGVAGPVRPPCPACGGGLERQTLRGQAVEACARCGGLLFGRGGLPAFLKSGGPAWAPLRSEEAEPRPGAPCPACGAALHRIRWQEQPVRVSACTACWAMFASVDGLAALEGRVEVATTPPLAGPALLVWRVLDAFTEWLVNPPKRGGHLLHRRD